MIAIRLVWAVITFAVYVLVLRLVPWALGFVVVPFAIWNGQWITSPVYPHRKIFTAPRRLWLWGNDEDGYDPPWFVERYPKMKRFHRRYLWAAWRNPVNNLRFIKKLHPPQRADKVKWETRGNLTLVWQGLLYRIMWRRGDKLLRIGWKYVPRKEDAWEWQNFGQGFGISWKDADG